MCFMYFSKKHTIYQTKTKHSKDRVKPSYVLSQTERPMENFAQFYTNLSWSIFRDGGGGGGGRADQIRSPGAD